MTDKKIKQDLRHRLENWLTEHYTSREYLLLCKSLGLNTDALGKLNVFMAKIVVKNLTEINFFKDIGYGLLDYQHLTKNLKGITYWWAIQYKLKEKIIYFVPYADNDKGFIIITESLHVSKLKPA